MISRHTATDRPPDVKPEPLSRQCLLVLAVVVLFCVSVKIVHHFVVQGFLDWYYLVLDCVFDKEYINREEREHCKECDCKTTLNEKLCSQHRLCQNIWPLGGWMSAPFNTGGVLYLLRYLPAIVILLAVGGCCYMYMEDWKKASDRSQASGSKASDRSQTSGSQASRTRVISPRPGPALSDEDDSDDSGEGGRKRQVTRPSTWKAPVRRVTGDEKRTPRQTRSTYGDFASNPLGL